MTADELDLYSRAMAKLNAALKIPPELDHATGRLTEAGAAALESAVPGLTVDRANNVVASNEIRGSYTEPDAVYVVDVGFALGNA